MSYDLKVAYFTMEIGLESGMPTYGGGLGVLAGDTVISAANLSVPMVVVSLLHRKGYFYQKLDSVGWQTEDAVEWSVEDYLCEQPERVSVTIENRQVHLRAWKFEVVGFSNYIVPVYFIDSNLPENSEWDRSLTDYLYGGDPHYRLCQEVILGIGGLRMLRSIGYNEINRFHMNEGHASFLTIELLDELCRKKSSEQIVESDIDAVRKQCVFTTHTPVPAGHDQFPMDLVYRVIGQHPAFEFKEEICCNEVLNMTHLALNLSHYINGVAKKHGQVSRDMFTNYIIDSITNGVNVSKWTAQSFKELFDRYIPGWQEDNFSLRYALNIPNEEILKAHVKAKRKLIEFINRESNSGFDFEHLTLGFARRSASYKRADLIFYDLTRLKEIAKQTGPFQIVFAGKAHPQDSGGKELIKRIFQAREMLKGIIKVIYLPNYDMELARLITAGVDVWLNTPIPPHEASGTSGMKAALNGVPSLSILDGWWIEGCIEGVTGWAIGEPASDQSLQYDSIKDSQSLYQKLEQVVIPTFYKQKDRFIDIMSHAIALNGSFFNTQRMMLQYVLKAYFV